jgi:hypothetical protein
MEAFDVATSNTDRTSRSLSAYAAGTFSWPDWLSKHGLSPEQKSRDVQTAILLATILVDLSAFLMPHATAANRTR